MKVIRGLRHLKPPKNGSCVTIGVFDGVHIGHRRIIETVVSDAARSKTTSIVVTFDPHPSKVLNPKARIPSLISLNHRIRLIEELGVDMLVILKFTRALGCVSGGDFVKNILVKKLGAKEVCVGENFYFGKGGRTGVKFLKKYAARYGVKVRAVRQVRIDGKVVSSSRVRVLISSGDLKKAERLLGRPVSVLGTVVAGARLARSLGYPTANVNPHHEVIPPSGVYAVKAKIGTHPIFHSQSYRKMGCVPIYSGILNIGVRPTFYAPRDQEPSIEAHVFDFDSRIYGRDIEILFVKKLRGERKFKDPDGLVARIKRDEKLAKKILEN